MSDVQPFSMAQDGAGARDDGPASYSPSRGSIAAGLPDYLFRRERENEAHADGGEAPFLSEAKVSFVKRRLAETCLGGWRFGCFTNCAILFNWSFLLPYYLMAAANGLVTAFYDADACYWQWALLVLAFLLATGGVQAGVQGFVLYAQRYLGWGQDMLGLFSALFSALFTTSFWSFLGSASPCIRPSATCRNRGRLHFAMMVKIHHQRHQSH